MYVHFPFCLSRCSYCDFATQAVARQDIPQNAYAQAVLREWELRSQSCEPVHVLSVYFGGGTPSLWSLEAINRVVSAICSAHSEQQIEVTVECNPCSLETENLPLLRRAGVTRLSFGVQSLDPKRLALLGRRHDATRALEVICAANRAGFEHLSADMILGVPGQRASDAIHEARVIARSGVDHLSAYILSLSRSSELAQRIEAGDCLSPEEEQVVQAYLGVSEELSGLGFGHYEVSNFAKPGGESKHNLWIWRGGDYFGLGAGAVGTMTLRDGRVVRASNRGDAHKYIDTMRECDADDLWERSAVVETAEVLAAETRLSERIMLGLRLAEGVDLEEVGRSLGLRGWTRQRERAARLLQERGRLERVGTRVRIPRPAWLWESDTVARLL